MLFSPLQSVWQEVLRCVSRWDLLVQAASGGPTDAQMFAQPTAPGLTTTTKRRTFFSRSKETGMQLSL